VNEDTDNVQDTIDSEGRNLTQQRMDEAGVEDRPVDFVRPSPGETVPDAAAAADSAAPTVEFEPDVPLVAEVNRAAGEASDRKRLLVVGGLLAGSLVVLRRLLRR
jgi:Uma2 family endonuclease